MRHHRRGQKGSCYLKISPKRTLTRKAKKPPSNRSHTNIHRGERRDGGDFFNQNEQQRGDSRRVKKVGFQMNPQKASSCSPVLQPPMGGGFQRLCPVVKLLPLPRAPGDQLGRNWAAGGPGAHVGKVFGQAAATARPWGNGGKHGGNKRDERSS